MQQGSWSALPADILAAILQQAMFKDSVVITTAYSMVLREGLRTKVVVARVCSA